MVCKEAYTTVSISAKSVFDEITNTKIWAEDKNKMSIQLVFHIFITHAIKTI